VDGVLLAVRDESGELLGFCKIMRDATHRKLTEDALQRSYQNLSEFAHVVSHDLQAPLRAISTFTELFVQNCAGAGRADVLEWRGFIKDAVEQMRTLIRDLLEYAHILGKEVAQTQVDLETALEHVCKRLEPALKEAEGAFTHDPLPTVMGDETLLVQLFQNLVGNAVKYRSAEKPRIHISAALQGAEWMISVADNGIGIKADQQQRIFEPFKRLHGKELPGNGIGLAICKRIVERYGKRIWVASEEGQGATFYFTLPARG
jgi:light-regulated signal transduction histidine kinase (bacteriophytochrome)